MQVSVETTEGLERKMTVAVPCDKVDSAVNARLQEAAKTIRLNGFRKGKVPLKVVKNRFGEGVRQEVVGEIMNQSFYEAINQESLKPAGQPRIEPTEFGEGKDLEFTAVFEVYPEITLPDFSLVKGERLTAEVTETDIDEMIETLRQDYIRTARAKGLSEGQVEIGHALRNAIIPVVTVIALDFGYLFSGALMTETIFSYPGMGKLIFDSIMGNDFNLALIVLLFATALTLCGNFLADVAYVALDRRISLAELSE